MGLSIYGSTGNIGSYYYRLYGGNQILRSELTPKDKKVLYFISTTNNYNIYSDPTFDVTTNLLDLTKRLDACHKAKIKEFNFISSWYVYGKREYCTETDPCEPNGFYSITKRAAEQLVIDFCNTFKIKWRILRLGNVYGSQKNQDLVRRNALHAFVELIKANRNAVVFEGVERDFIHIFDTCRAISLILNEGLTNTIYNVGTGVKTPLLGLLETAKQLTNSSSKIEIIKPSVDYHQSLVNCLDVTRLQNLGFSPIIDLEQGIEDLCHDQKFCTPDRILTEPKFKQLLTHSKKESGIRLVKK
jgi:nucleoside-diphosphate-sugar epimerase